MRLRNGLTDVVGTGGVGTSAFCKMAMSRSIRYPRSSPGRSPRTMLFSLMSRCKIPIVVRYSCPDMPSYQHTISIMTTQEGNVPNSAPRNPRTKSCTPQKYFTGRFNSETEMVSTRFSIFSFSIWSSRNPLIAPSVVHVLPLLSTLNVLCPCQDRFLDHKG